MKISQFQTFLSWLVILLFLSGVSFGQEKNLLFTFQLNHYLAKDNNGEFIPFSPGFELLYQFSLNENWTLASGFNYTISKWEDESEAGMSLWRRKAQEVFIPLFAERKIGAKSTFGLGVYPGWLLDGKEENRNKNSDGKWIDQTDYYHYDKSQKFSCDLYLDFNYRLDADPRLAIVLGPFVKYKLTDNWMEQRRKPFSFGVNIGFLF